MPKFTDLMSEAATGHATITEDWMQGRTTYGGLSAALCYSIAHEKRPEGMTLRSAQIGFVGPAAGPVTLNAEVLRQGKSSCYVSADVRSEAGIATRALFIFGSSRESHINFDKLPKAPKVEGPEAVPKFFGSHSGRRPAFAENFNWRLAGGFPPMAGVDEADVTIWLRHTDENASGMLALLAIGDAPPPAVLSTFTQPARISSMNWSIEMLTSDPVTEDRWYLARHTSPQAADGYSVQNMTMWNRAGQPMMIGRQTVAIFG